MRRNNHTLITPGCFVGLIRKLRKQLPEAAKNQQKNQVFFHFGTVVGLI
jgi:hypothetical protein